jgi:glyoxylase-like metal-dependent hydrolase (beta-lactamase superfamily II)
MGKLTTCFVALAGLALATSAPAAPDVPERIAEGVWLIPGSVGGGHQPDGNTIVFEAGPRGSKGGLVVMDTGRHPAHRQAILAFAAQRHAPISAVINSHWHLDHVSGNPALKAAFPGLKVYASDAIDEALTGFLAKSAAQARELMAAGKIPAASIEELKADLATTDNGHALRPDVTVTKSGPVRFGPLSLRLNLAPGAATAGDIWVYDEERKLVAAGDLVTLPAAFLDTACPAGWRAALAAVDATPFTILIPGHGAPMTHQDFQTYRKAFDGLIDCAASDAAKTACAERWVSDLGALLPADQAAMARGMSGYYVEAVLRGEPARQACATKAR